jgi:hypothetical protein
MTSWTEEFRNNLVSVPLRPIHVESNHTKTPGFHDEAGNLIETHEHAGDFREFLVC